MIDVRSKMDSGRFVAHLLFWVVVNRSIYHR
jgi:hypothetical protein